MNHPFLRLSLALLLLFALPGCGQSAGKSDQASSAPASQPAAQSAPSIPAFMTEWPTDQAPAELPEYPSGTVTAAAVDGEGVLTIKVTDTSQSDLYDYLEQLQGAGWIVSSGNAEAEALLGLYTVTFSLQGTDDTVLQIDVYAEEAGSWPAGQIPPDVPEPQSGTLVGKVEVLESGEGMWYFDYTYDGIDEADARAYMELLMESGWEGDGGQLYKSFEWNGKRYAADIEIYETVETRTTFTCNFYLS